MQRFNQRQGFLVSAILHLTILMMLIAHPPTGRRPDEIDVSSLEHKDIVFLPPAATLRKLLPQQARRPAPTPTPAAAPTPLPAGKKDRISVGPPSDMRQKVMILRREDDLTKAPKGEKAPTPLAATPFPTPAPIETAQKAAGVEGKAGREGLKVPPGLLGQTPSGDEGRKPLVGPLGPSITRAEAGVAQRVIRDSQAGIPTGTGINRAGFNFDPQGADFSLWLNHAKNELYRNWTPPQAAELGFRGHVDFVFTVERDGRISSVHMQRSSGTPSLDKAAEFALTSSNFMPLPEDYGPPRLTIQITFFYNEAPQGS